ncbi:MAG: NfeD family protein, partial [Eubacteriales bacterium]
MTMALVSIWFIPSAGVALILSICHVHIGIQIAVFAVLSFLLLIFSRKIFKKALRIKPVATNADSLIGERAVVTEDICNVESKGAAKVRGLEWSARSADGSDIEAGTVVLVTGIEGVKLICTRDKSDKK